MVLGVDLKRAMVCADAPENDRFASYVGRRTAFGSFPIADRQLCEDRATGTMVNLSHLDDPKGEIRRLGNREQTVIMAARHPSIGGPCQRFQTKRSCSTGMYRGGEACAVAMSRGASGANEKLALLGNLM